MKHKTYFAILTAAMMAATGCLKVKKKSEVATPSVRKVQPARAKQPITRDLHLDDIFIEAIGQLQPDVYSLNFSWPESKDRVRVSYSGQQLFLKDTSIESSFVLNNLQGGQKYSMLIEILDQQNHIITSTTKDIEIPKDYIFSSQFKLTGHMKIKNERVFMNNSVITTENFNLEIQTKTLIILEKSLIQNFIPGAKAKPGREGRSGGLVSIESQSAEGDLLFTMNSEAGGDGLKGYEHQMHSGSIVQICPRGGSGYQAGRNGDLRLNIKQAVNFHSYPQETLSDGGFPGPKLDESTPADYPTTRGIGYNCPQIPGAGASARPGKICLNLSDVMPAAGCE